MSDEDDLKIQACRYCGGKGYKTSYTIENAMEECGFCRGSGIDPESPEIGSHYSLYEANIMAYQLGLKIKG